MKEWQDILREWKQNRSESMALATLVRATGSSYRRPGARMLVSGDGKITAYGSVVDMKTQDPTFVPAQIDQQ